MKKLLLSITLILSLSMIFAATITENYKIEKPELTMNEQYTKVNLNNGIYLTKPGEPALPAIPVNLLLPPNEKAASIEINYMKPTTLEGTHTPFPFQTPVPISQKQLSKFTRPNPEIYNSNRQYPYQNHSELITHYYRGHSIAITNIFPIRYNPQTRKITYYQEVEVTINSNYHDLAAEAFSENYRTNKATVAKLGKIIDNHSTINRYPNQTPNRINNHMLVIITEESYLSDFEEFVEFKTKQGFNPLVETVEDIYTQYDGVDNQDKIRNYIKYCYENYETEYVILGGDTETIPHRGFRVAAGSTTDSDIPADMYYSCLDRNGTGDGPDWNTNNNSFWGETQEADYYPELAVGRISADASSEFEAVFNKQMMYQMDPVEEDLEKALMVGEELNDNPLTYGGDYKDQIVDGGTHDGYATAGISENFDVSTVYAREGYWSAYDLQDEMNSGINLLNHLGHSMTWYNMKFENPDVNNSNLTSDGVNHNFYIIYSQGCYPASFDNRDNYGSYGEDCIAEKFVTIENGCAAYIGNSRYGWYQPGGTNASSQYFDRQFFDAIFGDDITNIGKTLNESKIAGANQCNGDAWFRWTYYEINLFGDPTLDIWTATPENITANHPDAIPMTATEIEIETDVPDALVGLSLDGENINGGFTNAAGNITLQIDEPFENVGTLDINITKHNYNIYQNQIEIVPANTPFIIVDDIQINTENNNIIEFGEEATLDITFKNVGLQDATDPNFSASIMMDQYIEISDYVESFSTLGAEEEVTIEDAITIHAANDVPNDHQFVISTSIESEEDTWAPNLSLEAFAPEISLGNILIDDGDNNLLEPGDECMVMLDIENIGGAGLSAITGDISTSNPYFEISNTSFEVNEIEPNTVAGISFDLLLDENTPDGSLGSFNFSLTGNNEFTHAEEFNLTVGAMDENFESGDFDNFEWEFSGDADWTVSSSEAHQGQFSALSGNISHSSTTTMSLTVNVMQNGEVSFFKKVSCEDDPNDNYDYLYFEIDGQEMGRWDGEVDWSESSYPIETGVHTFSWTYLKDTYVSDGQDCAWIDDISLPVHITQTEYPVFFTDTEIIDFGEILVNEPQSHYISILNMGEGTLEGTIILPEGFEIQEYRQNRKSKKKSVSYRDELDYEIEAGSSSMYGISFTPEAEGELDEQIIITSNDPYHSAYGIEVTATIQPLNTEEDNSPAYITTLKGNHPNPFNPTTSISFSLAENQNVKIVIYNVKGQKVRELLNNNMEKGKHNITWNGKDDYGQEVSSNVYFYRMKTGRYTSTKKMLLLK